MAHSLKGEEALALIIGGFAGTVEASRRSAALSRLNALFVSAKNLDLSQAGGVC
ncbi:hypothetical protein MKK58_23425 [Methylobacterium sp. J-078]|uniref:hypothetical protein n=1 Tax=Methylobacterium sp. J-078 TaxID=2836657 RepID=UPI001FBBC2C6|nr:hypothetical protein [Methylobacterium sp. J-078]MCJ2047467.1 hypothetical protein [Methylobacterium sp. J-078]